MSRYIEKTVKSFLSSVGINVMSSKSLAKLRESKNASEDLLFLKTIQEDAAGKAAHLLDKSKSQLRQDIFVLAELEFKRDGFFIEFGATNGVDLSNTHLLEKEFGWTGILAEPATCWHSDLKSNRSASIDFDCVWNESGQSLEFNEVKNAEFSTISSFSADDMHSGTRQKGTTYSVNTISLTDLLKRHKAPQIIDYLSIDTEGSEYEILKSFNFDSYSFSVITCEHNFTEDRDKIFKLLTSKGFERKFENLSKFDDWYVRR